MTKKPNVIYIFSDQHRAEATAYRGNPDVKTPNMDRLAKESLDFTRAVAGMPVCCPARASLITGQYAQTHGVFVNDVPLGDEAVSIAQAFKTGGYQTAYVGKWHLNGNGRSNFIPEERRQGFDFWRVLECTHDYNHSYYYEEEPGKKIWDGYDAEAQTRCAMDYIQSQRTSEAPYLLMLSWGPPHNPYDTAPQKYKDMYDPAAITLRPNVPDGHAETARIELAGYYAHITALDHLLGEIMHLLEDEGMLENTVFVYTSDHGDMLGSQGNRRKQRPWDESILVPMLLRYPALFGKEGKQLDIPINTPDIMPTLLGLCGMDIPATVEGINYSPYLKGEQSLNVEGALIQCIHPFGEWLRAEGGKEYRGIRTERYTYVRDLQGPWLLYDNETDPYQLNNLCDQELFQGLQNQLDDSLNNLLNKRKDEFLHGDVYIERWGYKVDDKGTVPFTW
jgi:arylsulfatase A-like enzyme